MKAGRHVCMHVCRGSIYIHANLYRSVYPSIGMSHMPHVQEHVQTYMQKVVDVLLPVSLKCIVSVYGRLGAGKGTAVLLMCFPSPVLSDGPSFYHNPWGFQKAVILNYNMTTPIDPSRLKESAVLGSLPPQPRFLWGMV